jgi:diaminopimelate decarboxylase
MGTKQLFSPLRQSIAGVPIQTLAEQFATPCYVYDAAVIRRQIERLRQFDVIRYAQKANSNIAILDLMRREGVLVDAVSAGEIFRAQAAGYSLQGIPCPVVYTADIFDRETLNQVISHNIRVNVGSPDMISQLGQKAAGREITLRINPGFGHGHTQKTNTGGEQSKHGIWHEQVEDCLAMAAKYDLTISGLHMHIGSGTDFEHLSQVCQSMQQIAQRVGKSVTTISAGGGLPTPYREADSELDIARYFDVWDAVRNSLQDLFGHEIQLEIEPGRFLVAESGFLISEIRAIKRMGTKLFYIVDAGFNNLARPILYGAYHPMSIAHHGEPTSQVQQVVVGGPLCESGDIFTQEEGGFVSSRELPLAKVGDYLVIECAGAYGFVMSSNYNSKPLVAEVLIDNGQVHQIRKRQSNEDLIAGEAIPGGSR